MSRFVSISLPSLMYSVWQKHFVPEVQMRVEWEHLAELTCSKLL